MSEFTTIELRFGGDITDHPHNLLRCVRDGAVVSRSAPRWPNNDFPLQSGKAWLATCTIEIEQPISEHGLSFNVIWQEQALIPAGIFDALRVEGSIKHKARMKKDRSSGEQPSTHR